MLSVKKIKKLARLLVSLLVCLSLGLGLVLISPSEAVWAEAYQPGLASSHSESKTFAELVLDQVNQARTEAGLDQVYLDSDLGSFTKQRAVDLTRYFSHDRPNGSICYAYYLDSTGLWGQISMGENIARSNYPYLSTSELASYLVRGWLGSPSHRANILDPTWVRMSISYTVVDGMTYACQWFQD